MPGYGAIRVVKRTTVEKERRIPTRGEVLVGVGDVVEPETVVARGTAINTDLREVSISAQLGVDPEEVKRYLLKKVGDVVKADEAIAIRRSFFGRSTRVCRSPMDGTIESVTATTGRVLIRGPPIQLEVKAHIPGRVKEVFPGEGAVISTRAALIQGMFGVGGEARGEIAVAVEGPETPLTAEGVTEDLAGKILVGGAQVTLDALRKAAKTGAKGVITGGIDEKDLADFLGYEIGIGVTGEESAGLTLIITEGFGTYPMREETFRLLKSFEGRLACIDGSTQVRTRMLRPEVIIPLSK